MAGIGAFGAYISLCRIGADAFARAWGTRYMAGEKAVALYDEDSVTMAATAAAADWRMGVPTSVRERNWRRVAPGDFRMVDPVGTSEKQC